MLHHQDRFFFAKFTVHFDFRPPFRITFAELSLFTTPAISRGCTEGKAIGVWLSQSLTFGNLATATRILWCPSPANACKNRETSWDHVCQLGPAARYCFISCKRLDSPPQHLELSAVAANVGSSRCSHAPMQHAAAHQQAVLHHGVVVDGSPFTFWDYIWVLSIYVYIYIYIVYIYIILRPATEDEVVLTRMHIQTPCHLS